MRTGTGRRRLVAALVGIFAVQTTLVYVDQRGYASPALSAQALHGSRIWHAHNCQGCHQVYGFGGFLGPDLTNAIGRLGPERLQAILTEGAAQMPTFHLSGSEIAAVKAFLTELDATGLGQPEPLLGDPAELLDGLVGGLAANGTLEGSAEIGRALVKEKQCIACHLPNPQSTHGAPDFTMLAETPGREGVLSTVNDGRILRGMPAFHLTSAQADGLMAFLEWLHANREPILASFAVEGARSRSIPWFEYR